MSMTLTEFYEIIGSLYAGLFRLDDKELTNSGIKKPLLTRKTELLPVTDFTKYQSIAGELKEGLMFLDCDSEKETEIIKEICFKMNFKTTIIKTGRGAHFYFKNPSNPKIRLTKTIPAGHVCAIGLNVEYKVATDTKTPPYEPLKMLNKARTFIINDKLYKGEELDELPYVFWHYKPRDSLLNMQNGDGRNTVLSEFAMGLQKMMPPDYVMDCCKIINQKVFQEPLPDNEMKEILRPETFRNATISDMDKADKLDFYEKGYGFKFQEAATWFIKTKNVIKINNAPHIYYDGYYSINKIESILVDSIANTPSRERTEILKYIAATDDGIEQLDNQTNDLFEYINIGSRVWSNKTGEFKTPSPDIVSMYKINVQYDENAYSADVDNFLKDISVNDPDIENLILEIGGFILSLRNEAGQVFYLIGGGANGKSTFLNVLIEIFGQNNGSFLSLKQLSSEFLLEKIIGKLYNISGEVNEKFIEETDTFKKLVTGDMTTANVKHKSGIDFKNAAKLIFAGNEMPRSSDKSYAFLRRLIFIPFLATFKKETITEEGKVKIDPYIIKKLTTPAALEYWLKLFIEAYFRIQKNGFTVSEKVIQMANEYKIYNNPVIEFINECEETQIDIESTPADTFYKDYLTWCRNNNYKPLSRNTFSTQLKDLDYYSTPKWDKNTNRTQRFYIKDS